MGVVLRYLRVSVVKTEATAHDFATGQTIRPHLIYKGNPLPTIPSSQPFKYLGVRMCLNGDMSHERNYILTRTAELVAKLRGHRYTPSQMHRVVTAAIVSVFRYSAPWVDYSANDLERVALLWRRGFRFAWRMRRSTASAVFQFPRAHGGLACPLPEAILCETLAHVFTHATWHFDNTKRMFMDRVRWDTLALGVGTVEDAMQDLRLSIAPSDRLKSMWQQYLYFGTRANQSILWPACIPPISPGDTLIGLSFPARRLALNLPRTSHERTRYLGVSPSTQWFSPRWDTLIGHSKTQYMRASRRAGNESPIRVSPGEMGGMQAGHKMDWLVLVPK